jgi:glycosyltransferase involved in cell wall biosynthesis
VPARRPVLLAVATLPPLPVQDGYALRVSGLLHALAEWWSIVLLAPHAPDGAHLPDSIARHEHIALAGRGLTYPWRFDGSTLGQALRRLAAAHRPHRALVWPGAETAWLAAARDLPPAVMDMIDCNPLEFWHDVAAGPGLRRRVGAARELAIAAWHARRAVRSFAATTCVGERDAAWLTRLGGQGRVHVVPNGVALPNAASLLPEAPVPTLAFTGTLDFPPNVDAVRHAATLVWPLVREARPEAQLVIAGRRPVPEIAALHGHDGIAVLADVPDLVPLLRGAWAAIAPMRTGAGIKNKVLEAWACARPVVLSSLATNGLVLPPEHRVLVQDDPRRMADAVLGLFAEASTRHALGQAARAMVADRFTWQAAAARLDALLRGAGQALPGGRLA